MLAFLIVQSANALVSDPVGLVQKRYGNKVQALDLKTWATTSDNRATAHWGNNRDKMDIKGIARFRGSA